MPSINISNPAPSDPLQAFVGQKDTPQARHEINRLAQSIRIQHTPHTIAPWGDGTTITDTGVTYSEITTTNVHNRIIESGAITSGDRINWIVEHERQSAVSYISRHKYHWTGGTATTYNDPITIYNKMGQTVINVDGSGGLRVVGDYPGTAATTTNANLIFERQEYDEAGNLRLIYSLDAEKYKISEEEYTKQRLRNIIKQNLLIKIGNRHRQPILTTAQQNELKARETLRDMVTENDWRRYVTNGFLMVKGQTGRWYQIFNNYSERVRVYEANKKIAEICIHSDQACPPTDHVINLKVLAEIDEEAIWQGGNVTRLEPSKYSVDEMRQAMQRHIAQANIGPPQHQLKINKPQPKNLVEAYNQIKRIA